MSGGIQQLVFSGPLILAVPIAAAAGAVTFASPCVLPLVPGYLAYATGMSGTDGQRAARRGRAASGTAVRTATAAATDVQSSAAAVTRSGAGTAAGRAGQTEQTGRADRPDGTAPVAGAVGARGAGQSSATGVAAPPLAARWPGRGRTVAGTALFVLGFSVLFAVYGAASGSLGGALIGHHQRGLIQTLGAVTVVLGLLFAGVFDRFSFAGRMIRPTVRPRAGLAGAPLLGVMFGLGWTPCIGPTLTTVLTLSTTTGTAGRGAFLAFVYGLGLGIPFLVVSVAFQRSMTVFAFARRHARLVAQIGGALLVVVGLLEVTGVWATWITWLKVHWVGGYQAPL